ncbi:MAG: hypothetical protein QOJ59_914 [Thermomicrobiales bacterium]|jgi:antitoxin (DNA-binding transcriptional repressor) of toxin-antitoxin stability system|nr:hypothetical protein [Thermomicrobiales bacterium]
MMVAERKVIDVDESPDLTRLVERVSESKEATLLRRKGQAVALITPLGPRPRRRRPHMDPVEAARILRETAGGWKGLVDTDKLIEDIYADRELSSRELPEL